MWSAQTSRPISVVEGLELLLCSLVGEKGLDPRDGQVASEIEPMPILPPFAWWGCGGGAFGVQIDIAAECLISRRRRKLEGWGCLGQSSAGIGGVRCRRRGVQ